MFTHKLEPWRNPCTAEHWGLAGTRCPVAWQWMVAARKDAGRCDLCESSERSGRTEAHLHGQCSHLSLLHIWTIKNRKLVYRMCVCIKWQTHPLFTPKPDTFGAILHTDVSWCSYQEGRRLQQNFTLKPAWKSRLLHWEDFEWSIFLSSYLHPTTTVRFTSDQPC